MKTTFKAWLPLAAFLTGCSAVLILAWRAHAQEPKQVVEPPLVGTYYLLSFELEGKKSPPYPFDPYEGTLPVYQLKVFPNSYLVADSPEDYLNLRWRKTMQTYSAEDREIIMDGGGPPPPPGGGGGGGGGSGGDWPPPMYLASTNLCLLPPVGTRTNTIVLAITNAAPGAAYDLLNTTNLAPLSLPALSLTNWLWLARGEAGQTNFVVTFLPEPESYYLLGTMLDSDGDGLTDALENLVFHTNPNNPDTDGDGLPDGWEWEHFGNFDQTASGDYDSDGVSNGLEFTNSTDPNTIDFTVVAPNHYANSSTMAFQIDLAGGVPSSQAVLVDSTNFAAAVWTAYDANPVANLGYSEGWRQVWVGLRGRSPTSQPTWQTARVKLDLTPPHLVITNPVSSVVTRPVIQLQGFCPESLTGLTYDLTNAAGFTTNHVAFVVRRQFDTNGWEFTTNYFHCFDVRLTNGANALTLRATDLAGNTTVTNLTFTVDYSSKTNPPVVVPGWPREGTSVGSSNFTWRGWVDDPAAQVAAQWVTDGVTNRVPGRVGREGDFWIENVPLAAGSNLLTLVVTDAAGNASTTNVHVRRSEVELTVAGVGWDWAGGRISTSGYTVWVNGVATEQYEIGDEIYWHVPWDAGLRLTLDSTTIQARAIPNTDNGGQGSGGGLPGEIGSGILAAADAGNPTSSGATDIEAEFELTVGQVYMSSYQAAIRSTLGCGPGIFPYEYFADWQEAPGGSGAYSEPGGCGWGNHWGPVDDRYTWMPGRHPFPYYGTVISLINGTTNLCDVPGSGAPGAGWWEYSDVVYTSPDGSRGLESSVQTEAMMVTGGRRGETGLKLFDVTASAGGVPERITIHSIGTLAANGHRFALLPARAEVPVTPKVEALNHYWFWVYGEERKPRIFLKDPLFGTIEHDITDTNFTVFVGQKINLSCYFPGSLPTNFPAVTEWQWTIPGYAISNYIANDTIGVVHTNFPTAHSNVVYYWVDGGRMEVACRVKIMGRELSAKATLNVLRPSADWSAVKNADVAVDSIYHAPALHFGWLYSATNKGMLFKFTNPDLKGYGDSWNYQWAQVGSTYARVNNYTNNVGAVISSSGLDTHFPGNTFSSAPSTHSDAPGEWTTGRFKVLREDFFTNYLFFKPLEYESIPIPIKKLSWSWSGLAITNDLGQWTLLSSPTNATIHLNNVETMEFPIWTNNMLSRQPVLTNWF